MKRILTIAGKFVLLLACVSAVHAQTSPVAERVRDLNNDLLRVHGETAQATRDPALPLQSEAAEVIEERSAALAALIAQDPAQALSFAFSPELLAELAEMFPQSASRLESWGTWQGPIEYWIIDGADLKSYRSVVRMQAGRQTLDVRFAGPQPQGLQSGDVLLADGVLVGNTLVGSSVTRETTSARSVHKAAESMIATASITTTASTCSTIGVQNTAVLLVTFPGVTLNVTPQSIYDIFFSATGPSLDGYWREASSGQTSATGNVFGPYTLDSYDCTRLDLLRDAAITAAANAGVAIQNYTRIFLITPDICSNAGVALGTCTSLSSPNGPFTASTSILNQRYTSPIAQGVQLAAHEGGHNMGLGHAQLRAFGTEPLGALSAAGTLTEYGDHFSVMSASNSGHYAAPHKAMLGWLSNPSDYQTVTTSGTYTILPLETNLAGAKALKIQRGTGNTGYYLWIEYRQPIGNYDSTLSPTQLFQGATIHYEDPTTGARTRLLDYTAPSTYYDNPALVAGNTWVDPYTNLSLTVQSATASALTVSVNYGAAPCTPSAPSVSLSPPNPSLYPGQTVNYSVSIANNDTAGCSPSTFTLSSSEPSGWSTTFSAPSLTLSPGQSGGVTMGKGAPSGTPAGTYAVNVNAADTSSSGSGTANATVMTPSLTANLTVSGTTFTARQTVYFTTTVSNGGVAAGGASVTYTLTKADGSKVVQSVTANSSGTATWSYKIGQKDPKGTWLVVAQAASGSQTATSGSVTFTVQ